LYDNFIVDGPQVGHDFYSPEMYSKYGLYFNLSNPMRTGMWFLDILFPDPTL
jgi:hypothetical protein